MHNSFVIGEPVLEDVVSLENDHVCLMVDVSFGARVVSLIDRKTGREWLLQGARSIDVSEQAIYRGAASRGWDECFPTVLSCHHSAWGGHLRDHGMLWGRPWTIDDVGSEHLHASFEGDGIKFTRRLSLNGPELTAAYTVTSTRGADVPYLWSQHCVLSVSSDHRIALKGQGKMTAAGRGFDWPAHPERDLAQVGQSDEGFVLKYYGLTPAGAMARISGKGGGLRFDWDGSEIPALGIWLDYGGWPEEGPLQQVALEPTTGAADDLVAAEAIGQARWLVPGATHKWTVRLTLTGPDSGQTT
jgi:galactose mutarotase-like enzyme